MWVLIARPVPEQYGTIIRGHGISQAALIIHPIDQVPHDVNLLPITEEDDDRPGVS